MPPQNNNPLTPSGDPIYRHTEAAPPRAPQGESHVEEISAHIERHLGPVEVVFHEIVSDAVHIDVHYVKPSDAFPCARLITSGMSDLPMNVPEDAGAPHHLELMISLPPHWHIGDAAFKDEAWYWPVRLIKTLARLPHLYNTWLGFGHTMPNGDPAEPYAAGTALNGAILLPSVSAPEDFHLLETRAQKRIGFLSVVPLYGEEMALKLREGSDELLNRFDKHGIGDIVDVKRRNVAKKKLLGLF